MWQSEKALISWQTTCSCVFTSYMNKVWKLLSMNVKWWVREAAVCLQPQGGATELHHSSVDAPPQDGHRGQQTNHRARCRGGGGVTQVRVAALEGKTGNLEMIDTVTDQRSVRPGRIMTTSNTHQPSSVSLTDWFSMIDCDVDQCQRERWGGAGEADVLWLVTLRHWESSGLQENSDQH